MIVYLDGMDFGRTGIGRIFNHLLSGLLEAEQISLVHVVLPRARRAEFESVHSGSPKLKTRYVDYAPFSVPDLLFKHRQIRQCQPAADVLLFSNMNIPVRPLENTVVSINDLIMMSAESSWGVAKRYLFRVLTQRAIENSQGLVCISNATLRSVEGAFPSLRLPSRVIHPALEDRFLVGRRGREAGTPIVPGEYVLHVGIRVRHKNHEALIRGWHALRNRYPNLKLVIAGRRLWRDDVDRLRAELGLGSEMVELTNATDDQVFNLYSHASVFVFPSSAEGFGIPPLEAMALGVPVVCSGIPVLRETCGNGAHYFDPTRPGALMEAMREVLAKPEVRAELVEAGLRRAQLFTRERMVGDYLEFLSSVVKSK